MLAVGLFWAGLSLNVQASTDDDIDTLFTLVKNSTNDSGFVAVNRFLIPFKKYPCQMRVLLSAVRTIDGVANTTPLHVAVQGNNLAIAAIFYQKASVLGPDYDAFSHQMADAIDQDDKKPIDYTTNPAIIDFLDDFTSP